MSWERTQLQGESRPDLGSGPFLGKAIFDPPLSLLQVSRRPSKHPALLFSQNCARTHITFNISTILKCTVQEWQAHLHCRASPRSLPELSILHNWILLIKPQLPVLLPPNPQATTIPSASMNMTALEISHTWNQGTVVLS